MEHRDAMKGFNEINIQSTIARAMLKIAVTLVLLTISGLRSEPMRFDGYQVFSIFTENEAQVHALRNLQLESPYDIQVWNEIGLKRNVDLAVPPHFSAEFQALVEKYELEPTLKIKNVQDLIDAESSSSVPRAEGFGWERYSDLAEIYAFLDDLLARYPTVLTGHTVGYSYHGTPIRAVKLSHRTGNKAILIDSTIHAREWITSATSTFILNELLTSSDPDTQELARTTDWYFIPVLNPDGFNYTKSTNRLWRKTRYPHSHLCYGVDLNRNFGFQWMHVGASQNPCDITYAGPEAFSDPESRALADFFIARKEEINVYISFHSYSQYILLPFGYTRDRIDNYDQMRQVGLAGAAAVRERFGTEYEVGSTAELLYMNSGSSRDWMKGIHNLKVSYTIELRDKGQYGFILPADQIMPSCLEMMDGVKAMVNESKTLGYL